jgi:hypothetical protein
MVYKIFPFKNFDLSDLDLETYFIEHANNKVDSRSLALWVLERWIGWEMEPDCGLVPLSVG